MHYGPPLEEIFADLPELDIPFRGYDGWMLDERHQTIFVRVESDDGNVEPHAHGVQVGIMLRGEALLTVDGEDWFLKAGDTYVVPAGAVHSSKPQPGVLAIEIHDDPARHKRKD